MISGSQFHREALAAVHSGHYPYAIALLRCLIELELDGGPTQPRPPAGRPTGFTQVVNVPKINPPYRHDAPRPLDDPRDIQSAPPAGSAAPTTCGVIIEATAEANVPCGRVIRWSPERLQWLHLDGVEAPHPAHPAGAEPPA